MPVLDPDFALIRTRVHPRRPQGIPLQRIKFMHQPPSSLSNANVFNVELARYGLQFRSDTIYAVLEAPTMSWTAVVLLRLLFAEAVLFLPKKTFAAARAPVPQAAGVDAKNVEEEEEEGEEDADTEPDRWKLAADRRKHELQQTWSRLQAEGKLASQAADEHADRARYLQTQIMHRSAALIRGIQVSDHTSRGNVGNALGRTLKVVEEALDVCKGGGAVLPVQMDSDDDEPLTVTRGQ